MATYEVLVVGSLCDRQWPLTFGRDASIHRAPSLAEATAWLRSQHGQYPSLVVLYESRPGQWTEKSLAELRNASPLARFWRVSAPWCEGQARSGHPPSGCPGVYWHRLGSLQREIESATMDEVPRWSRPQTATLDERLLADCHFPVAVSHRHTIAIHSASAATADALAVVCRRAGFEVIVTTNLPAKTDASAVVWDTYPEALHDVRRIAQLRNAYRPASLVALVGFPRPEDVAAATEAGIAAVISKPFDADELAGWLCHRAELLDAT